MKRLVLLLCATISMLVYAQDIIVTHNSERINAFVSEISEDEVRYRKADNPDGPIFVISTSQIASILFENGDVRTFTQQKKPETHKTGVMLTSYKTVTASEDLKFIPGQQIERKHNNCYYYGNYEMNNAVFREFIKNNCPDAYRQYKTGYNMKVGGGISGLAIGLGGAILLGVAGGTDNYDTKVKCAISGGSLLAVGATSFCTFYFIGKKKQATAYQIFNEQCSNSHQPALSLGVGATNNGLCITMNF